METQTKLNVPSNRSYSKLIADNGSLIFKLAVIIVATLLIFYQDLYLIGEDALGSQYFNYVLIIPFLSGFLVYRKRRILYAYMMQRSRDNQPYTDQIVGACSIVASLIVYLYGSNTSYPLDFHLVAFQIFLSALILMLFNRQTLRVLLFPILLTSTALPSVVQFGLSSWQGLSWTSTVTAFSILKAMGLNVSFSTSVDVPSITLVTHAGQTFSFLVGVASSGAYSVVGFTLFAFFVAYIAIGPILRRILLFALGYPILVLVNIFRIVILVNVANLWGIEAFNIFHATSGIVLVFFVTLALLVIGDKFMKLNYVSFSAKSSPCPNCSKSLSVGEQFCDYCGRFLRGVSRGIIRREVLSIIVISLLVILFYSTLQPAVAQARSPTSVDLNKITYQNADTFLPNMTGWKLSYLGADTYIEEVLDQDAALIYSYTAVNSTAPNLPPPSYTVTVQISSGIHTPEASLVQYPLYYGETAATVLEDSAIQIQSSPQVTGQFFSYIAPGTNYVENVLYWNSRALFNFGSYSDFRNIQISIWGSNDSMVASGVIPTSPDLAEVQSAFLPFARVISSYWNVQGTNSVIQSTASKYGTPLLVLSIIPGGVFAGQEISAKRKERKSNAGFVAKLKDEREKQLIKAVLEASKSSEKATLDEIALQYTKLSGADMSKTELLSELEIAEKASLVTRKVAASPDGRPLLVWEAEV